MTTTMSGEREDAHIPRKHAGDRQSNAKRDVRNTERDHIDVLSDLLAASACPPPDKNVNRDSQGTRTTTYFA